MSSLKLQMELRQDRTLITRASVAKRIIEVVITAPAPAVRPQRLPLNIALVLDRSGSMEGDLLEAEKVTDLNELLSSVRERTLTPGASKEYHKAAYASRVSRS